jgi:hypothetical protein
MNYTTLEDALKQVEQPVEIEAWSVYCAFEQVQDGRGKRGARDTHGVALDADRVGQIGGDDHEGLDCRVGALTSRLAQSGAAWPCSIFSVSAMWLSRRASLMLILCRRFVSCLAPF